MWDKRFSKTIDLAVVGGPVFARGIQMAIAGFTELLLHTDADTPMVEDDQVWLVKLIVGFYGRTHIRNLEFQTDDINQIDIISASRIGNDTHFVQTEGLPCRVAPISQLWMISSNFGAKHRPLLVLGRESVR